MPAKPKVAPSGPTKPSQFRLTDEDLDTITVLAERWGGEVKPLDRTSVVREALRRARAAESGTKSGRAR
jgi:hypothetical protein